MKNILILSLFTIFLTSCGHNILTDYEVKGIDLSIPIGGYPFGIRIGVVKVNANAVRGNASYTVHKNSGTEVGAGAGQTTTVIQFSSNAQINEGNVEKIMTSEDVEPEVKKEFVKDYLGKQKAPEVLAVSTKTPVSTTASSDSPKVHSSKPQTQKSLFNVSSLLGNVVGKVANFFVLTKIGQILSLLARILAAVIGILFIRDIYKKIRNKIKNKKI